MNEEQNVICHQTAPCEHLCCKEVASGEHIQVRGDEVLPGGRLAPFRSRRDPMPAQNVSDRLMRDSVAEMSQSADDPVVSPARILARELDDKGARRADAKAGALMEAI